MREARTIGEAWMGALAATVLRNIPGGSVQFWEAPRGGLAVEALTCTNEESPESVRLSRVMDLASGADVFAARVAGDVQGEALAQDLEAARLAKQAERAEAARAAEEA